MRIVVSILAVLMGMLLLAAPAFAQTANGRISGTVKDQTGGAIVGAAVVVTDTARGLARNLTSDEAGAYLAPNLLPGNYTVRATFTGFQAWERTNIVLGVGGDIFVDVTMVPGAQTQTVTITEELPLVNTTSATLGGTLSSETILDLPLGSRNFKNLLDLRPGTVTNLGNDSGGGGAQSVNGLRNESSNEFLVEGLHGMDPFTGQSVVGNLALRGDGATVLPVDAIQEFSQQFNSKAEYGWKGGSSLNVGIKSGTNALHGTAYAFFRDVGTDARDYFNETATQPKVNGALQQFGATVGGPIKQDKLFFFLGYEQQNYTAGSASSTSVAFTDVGLLNCVTSPAYSCTPTPNSIAGSWAPDASNHLVLACLGVPAGSRSPRSLSLVSLNPDCTQGANYPNSVTGHTWLVPHGNDHGAPGASSGLPITTYFPNTQIDNTSIGGIGKVDYMLNEKNTINGFIFTGQGDNEGETTRAAPIWGNRVYQRPIMVAGTWTWLPSSSWANSFRVGNSRLQVYYRGLDVIQGLSATQLGLPTGVSTVQVGKFTENLGYPQTFSLAGFNAVGSRNTETRSPGQSLEVSDQVNYLRGNHSIRLGGTIMTNQQNGGTWAATRGQFTFGRGADGSQKASGLAGFLVGQNAIPDCTNGGTLVGGACTAGVRLRSGSTGVESATLFYGNPESHTRRKIYSLFLQDDWRIRPRLTLNLGVRYDLVTVPHDRDFILGSFDPNLGLVQEGIHIPQVHKRSNNNFGPRVGFAWDMFGTGRTVLRAGGSIIFELTPMQIYVETGNAAGSAGNPTAWVIGCTVGPYPDQGGGSDFDLATGDADNCTGVNGFYPGPDGVVGTVDDIAKTTPGTLFTPGGTRDVGTVQWSRGNNNIIGSVNWEDSTSIFPTSALHNCSPAIAVRDDPAATIGRAGGGCAITAMDRNLATPYIETWTLSLQHAIVNNVVLDVAYVGNHGTKLIGRTDDNQAPAGSGWTPASIATCILTPTSGNCDGTSGSSNSLTNAARPFISKFPYLTNIIRVANPHTSNYNGLQMTLTARNFHGMSLTSGYTYAKALDVASSSGSGVGTDSYNVGLDYGRANSDLRHRFTLSGVYQVPGVQGYAGLLEGWKLNTIFRYQTGRPWASGSSGDFMGTNRTTRWDFFGDAGDFKVDYTGVDVADFHPPGANSSVTATTLDPQTGEFYASVAAGQADLAINTPLCSSSARSAATLQALGCWTQGGSAITPPAPNSFGNMMRGLFSGPTYWALDFSVTKRQRITERFSAEFRAETFNTFNHPVFAQPATGLGCSVGSCSFGRVDETPAVDATNSFLGNGGPRRMQFGVKIIF